VKNNSLSSSAKISEEANRIGCAAEGEHMDIAQIGSIDLGQFGTALSAIAAL